MGSKAWIEGGADFVIEEAQKRLGEQGWDAVRPALSTTIRLVFRPSTSTLISLRSPLAQGMDHAWLA